MHTRKFTLLLSIIVLATSCMTSRAQEKQATTKEIAIVAHRGYWNCEEGGYARNSLAALKAAQAKGFWGSEFDVNMTADGQLLIFHDDNIGGKKLEDYPASEFSSYRLENGEAIPTLDQYLEQGKLCPETMLVLELKKHSCDEVETMAVEASIAKLREHGLFDPSRVMFISFSSHICREFVRLAPGFEVQHLGPFRRSATLDKEGVDGIDFNYRILLGLKSVSKQAHKRGMEVNAWTVNKEKTASKLVKLGVDFITTDEPEMVREVLSEMKIEEKK